MQVAKWLFNEITEIKQYFYYDTSYYVIHYKDGTQETVYSLKEMQFMANKTQYQMRVTGMVRDELLKLWNMAKTDKTIAGCQVLREPNGTLFTEREVIKYLKYKN